ncbi:ribonuclease E inhibitor RraB [Demequina aurantiaca]|uniref:ribonuclease E inhibitor RraB n=1 Tax=Demequina aurantiaca TaxID=676200 RepID=UPI003D3592D6
MPHQTTLDREIALWTPQREQRVKLEDVLTASRPVDHFAYFRRRKHAQTAVSALEAAGFKVETSRRGLKVALQATRDQALGDDEVAAFLAEVIAIVEDARGEYDGFGAHTA